MNKKTEWLRRELDAITFNASGGCAMGYVINDEVRTFIKENYISKEEVREMLRGYKEVYSEDVYVEDCPLEIDYKKGEEKVHADSICNEVIDDILKDELLAKD